VNKPTTIETAACTRAETHIRDLSELVAALDRRIPRNERIGEAAIRLSAAELKSEASVRITDLIQKSRH
jgi:hypothetical protein